MKIKKGDKFLVRVGFENRKVRIVKIYKKEETTFIKWKVDSVLFIFEDSISDSLERFKDRIENAKEEVETELDEAEI